MKEMMIEKVLKQIELIHKNHKNLAPLIMLNSASPSPNFQKGLHYLTNKQTLPPFVTANAFSRTYSFRSG